MDAGIRQVVVRGVRLPANTLLKGRRRGRACTAQQALILVGDLFLLRLERSALFMVRLFMAASRKTATLN